MLISICIVYSICHHAFTVSDLIQEAENQFDVHVSSTWAKGFLSCHRNALKARKTKLLASKWLDPDMVENVVEFCAQVETVAEVYPMKGYNVVNYNETQVFLTSEGQIRLEHAAKLRAQKKI